MLLQPLLCCNLNVCIETGEIKDSGIVNTVCTFRIFPISMEIRLSFAVLRPQVGFSCQFWLSGHVWDISGMTICGRQLKYLEKFLPHYRLIEKFHGDCPKQYCFVLHYKTRGNCCNILILQHILYKDIHVVDVLFTQFYEILAVWLCETIIGTSKNLKFKYNFPIF